MNFNIDDPLADLLSDNSLDNDNFFDITNVGGGNQKGTRPTTKAKGKMEDLFGIQEETEADVKNISPAGKPRSGSTPRITKQKPSIMQDDADDDDLGFDPKAPKGGGKKDFLDLLTTIESKRPATAAPTSTRPSISRQSTDTTTENSNLLLSQPRPKTSGGRRSSSQSAVINTDPLGLFGKQDKEANPTVSGMSTPISKRRAATADWLGLGVENTTTTATTTTTTQADRAETPTPQQTSTKPTTTTDKADVLRIPDRDETEEADTNTHKQESENMKSTQNLDTTAQNIFMLNALNLESNNAFATLQQQESQLLLATQMKNQERALLEMQLKQESMLQRQERQFQSLLQKQVQRQQQMEEGIKLQQQRINTHIQLMMTQPAIMGPNLPSNISIASEPESGFDKPEPAQPNTVPQKAKQAKTHEQMMVDQLMQAECDVKRLEMERQRLEDLVTNTKINFEQEIEMIEKTYVKRIKVAEDHLLAMQERLKAENEDLQQHYVNKIKGLDEELKNFKNDYEVGIGSLKQDHEDELRKLRKSHEDDIDMIRDEHRRMIEAVRQSKMLEFAAVQENGNYMNTIKMASANLENLSGGIQGLRDEITDKLEIQYRERENKLEARERRLEDAERRLRIGEECAEEEKRRLMDLVSSLEMQLSRMTKETGEENWQLRHRMSSLEAEKQALEREKEHHREQMTRDEKRIEELKSMQLAETERIMAELQEERNKIMIERTRSEIAIKLHNQSDFEKERLEVETQLKVANDSIKRADEERERFHKMQRDLEQRKRLLIDKEVTISSKEDELAESINAYRTAESRAKLAEKKAIKNEELLNSKLQMLNKHKRELSEKEEQLSQERLLLTEDRITLQNLKRQISQSKCTLCRMSAESVELSQLLQRNNILDESALKVENDQAVIPTVGNREIFRYMPDLFQLGGGGDIVDRMMDDNINASLRRMRNTTVGSSAGLGGGGGVGDFWNISALDDDSKKLAALNNNNRDDADPL